MGTAGGVELGFETLVGGALGVARIGAAALKATGGAGLAAAGSAAAGVALLASQYQMGQANAEKIQNWNNLAISNNLQIKPNDIDYALVSSVMPDLDFNSPQDREMIEHLARGAAIERKGPSGADASSSMTGFSSASSSSSHSSVVIGAAPVSSTDLTLGVIYAPLPTLGDSLGSVSSSIVTRATTGGELDQEDSNDIFERRKNKPSGQDSGNIKASGSSVAAAGAPFHDPDDGDEKNKNKDKDPENSKENSNKEQHKFDPSKDGEHDKIRRDTNFGKIYRAKDGKWYSKDRGGDRAHAGEHWKRFREEGGEFVHEADVDMTGKVMNKHKSATGIKIQIKNTIGIK